ncbi:hypothetical protein Ac2012v2_004197 [Leucoagaricus gongylophorus]
MHSKVPLQGAELDAYLQQEKEKKDKEAAQQAALVRNQRILEADEDESESDSDSDADEEDEVRRTLEDDMDIDLDDGDGKRRRRQGDNLDSSDWALDGDEGLTKQFLSFDIYLKGNVSRATSFFKTAGSQAQRFRMFPYVEKKRRVDEYGETIDVGMWLRKGKALEEAAESDEIKDYKRKLQQEDEVKKIKEPPSKYVTTNVDVQLACRLLFVDLEGLSDGRAVKTIIPQVNPRKMILVSAPDIATNSLLESWSNIRTMTKDIYAPSSGESIQIGQQTNTFSISISEDLLTSLRMSRFEDNEIGYVRGRVVAHATSTIPTLESACLPTPTDRNEIGDHPKNHILGSRPRVALPHSTMIGELKLTALKQRLSAINIQAKLVGEGVLICGGSKLGDEEGSSTEETIAVRKKAKGFVELEGNVSELYHKVRREVYEQLALVAAS